MNKDNETTQAEQPIPQTCGEMANILADILKAELRNDFAYSLAMLTAIRLAEEGDAPLILIKDKHWTRANVINSAKQREVEQTILPEEISKSLLTKIREKLLGSKK